MGKNQGEEQTDDEGSAKDDTANPIVQVTQQ